MKWKIKAMFETTNQMKILRNENHSSRVTPAEQLPPFCKPIPGYTETLPTEV
jgi:hypothetical protein